MIIKRHSLTLHKRILSMKQPNEFQPVKAAEVLHPAESIVTVAPKTGLIR